MSDEAEDERVVDYDSEPETQSSERDSSDEGCFDSAFGDNERRRKREENDSDEISRGKPLISRH